MRQGSLPGSREIRPGAVKRVYRYFSQYLTRFRGKLGLALLSGVGVTLMDLARPWPMKIIFDGILYQKRSVIESPYFSFLFRYGTPGALAVVCLAIILIAWLSGLFTYKEAVLTAEVGHRTTASIRRRLYDHLQKLSRSFHDTRQSGDLLVRLTGDINLLKEMLVDFIVTATGRSMVLVGMVAIMLAMDWQLTVMALFTVPPLVYAITRYTGSIKAATDRARHKEGKVASLVHESLGSISLIQAFSLERLHYDKFSRFNRSNLRAGLKTTRLVASFQRLVELVLAAGTCVVMWFGVRRVLDGVLTPGDLLVFVSYLRNMYKPLRRLAKLTSRVAKATACGERVLDILDRVPAIQDAPGAVEAPPFRGEVTFDHVHFSYNGSETILRDVAFTIEAGQSVALVGPSGVGKTTIANLLLRFYDPLEGAVRIDGRDIREFTLGSLRSQISVIMHEPDLFGVSVRENIAMGRPDASEEEIVEAARIANAHAFILGLEEGYDTVVGERGARLSRGQKQRIALARAAVRRAPIIILDEPTTGLDAESEFLVMQALGRLTKARTCITIAHKLSTIAAAERILVLDDARVLEDGSHEQLLRASPRYRRLYALQASPCGPENSFGGIE
jgi:ATP-binding cassette subfamily B protein